MNVNNRMSGPRIMAGLIVLLGSLAYIMLLAVVNGSLGFVCAFGVTIWGAVGVAKLLGEFLSLPWWAIIVGTIGCGLLRGCLRLIEQYSNHFIAFKLLAVLRDKIFRHLRILCPAKLESKQKGAIIAMITSDIETLEVFYAHTISPICIAAVVSVATLTFISLISSPYLALVALAGYVVIGILSPVFFSKKLSATGVAYRAEFASFSAYFLDSIKGITEIIQSNGDISRKVQVDEKSDKLLNHTAAMKKDIANSAMVTELLVSAFTLIALLSGVVLALNQTISVGAMIVGVVTIFGSFGPVIALSALAGNLAQTFASGDRVLKLLKEEPQVSDITDGIDFEFENLTVKNLSFRYDSVPVLDGVNISVNKGEIVALVGESGCGKSTLLKLLLRFWEKSGGQIAYNGIDVSKINTKSLLENVTMVSQTTYLFDDTIAENLRIAKPDATLDEMRHACEMASVIDFIDSLPDGFDTAVGTMGDKLSAGEKQRIGLARAFLRGAQLILLDEPTSNVDAENEAIILKAIEANRFNYTFVLVSHRMSTVAIADRVYELDVVNAKGV